MKAVKTTLMALMLMLSATVFAQIKTETIKVEGNCSSCKKHIETASKSAGVKTASWDKTTRLLTISYNPAKTTTDKVEKAVAAAGYDTDKYRGDDKAYAELDECCQYERKAVKSNR